MKMWRDNYSVHVSVSNGTETLEFTGNTESEAKAELEEFFDDMPFYDRRDYY